MGGWVMDDNGMSEPKLCKNGDKADADWIICPQALHREVWLCTNSTTSKLALYQGPAAAALRQLRVPGSVRQAGVHAAAAAAPPGASATAPLDVRGLQLENTEQPFCRQTLSS